ncbi:MAG: hypothetical protein E6Q96_09215 [Cyclobacteriaceae bacterium]|nr:MAG: hypothetical protein E6Q96_09215 [Cyclobacteriaceae bacterium]
MNEGELLTYLRNPDNGLKKDVMMNGVQMSVMYRPADFLVAQEMAAGVADKTKLKQKYGANNYFLMSLSAEGKEAIQAATMPHYQYSELLQTVSYRLGEFIHMTTSKRDTIPLQDFAYASTFGMGTSNDVLLAFKKDTVNNPEWIQINVGEFGLGLGRQTLRFNQDDIDALPKLKMNN